MTNDSKAKGASKDVTWRTCENVACKFQFQATEKNRMWLSCSKVYRTEWTKAQLGVDSFRPTASAARVKAAKDAKTARDANTSVPGPATPVKDSPGAAKAKSVASPKTPTALRTTEADQHNGPTEELDQEDSEDAKATQALTDQIEMKQAMLDNVKTQCQTKDCVVKQRTQLEADLKVLRQQKALTMPTKKQLSKARTQRVNTTKAKEKAATALKEAEAAIIQAQEVLVKAQEALTQVTVEDYEADQEVVRLEGVLRLEEGRQTQDPVANLVQFMTDAVGGMQGPDAMKETFLQTLLQLATTQPAAAVVPQTVPMQVCTDGGPGDSNGGACNSKVFLTGKDHIRPSPQARPSMVINAGTMNGLQAAPKALSTQQQSNLAASVPAKATGSPSALAPPGLQPPMAIVTGSGMGSWGPSVSVAKSKAALPPMPPPTSPPQWTQTTVPPSSQVMTREEHAKTFHIHKAPYDEMIAARERQHAIQRQIDFEAESNAATLQLQAQQTQQTAQQLA